MRTSAIFEEGWKVIDQTKNSARSKKNLEKKTEKQTADLGRKSHSKTTTKNLKFERIHPLYCIFLSKVDVLVIASVPVINSAYFARNKIYIQST